MKLQCGACHCPDVLKGRAFDGRRAYKCGRCGGVWTCGMQGRAKRYSAQRWSYQFAKSSGAGHAA